MTTWNSSDKSATITLSGGNLIATSSTAVSQGVRSTTSKSSGKVYWEVTLTTLTNDIVVGIATGTEALNVAGGLGADANGLGFYAVSPTQATYINSVQLNNGSTASSAGAVVSFALDVTNKLIWISTAVMRAASQNWNNSATANPGTGTGGQSLSTLGASPWFIMFNDDLGGAKATVNFGGTAFNQTVPTGFSSWDLASTTGTISSTTKKPTANLTGKLTETGTITSTTKKPVANVSGNVNEKGTISATTKKSTASLSGSLIESGTINTTVKKPLANLSAKVNETGSISSTTKKPTASVNGSLIESGTIGTTTKKPTASLNGSLIESGTISATTKKPTANLNGVSAAAGNTTGTIAATTKKPASSLNGTSVLPSETGTINATGKKPTAHLVGAYALPSETGTISATVKKLIASLIGATTAPPIGGPGDSAQRDLSFHAYKRLTERQRRKARSQAAKAQAKAKAALPASEAAPSIAPGGIGYDSFHAALAAAHLAEQARLAQIKADADDEEAAIEAILMAI